ncbi:MAG: rRNA maturation RNase YbeY [Chitinophagaceae bacterium]
MISTPPDNIVKFHYVSGPFAFVKRNQVKASLVLLFKNEHRSFHTLDYIFCNDKYLLKINKKFLGHDTLTDIITFDLSDAESVITGEIYISIERVKDNARLFKKTFQQELLRVIFHGALHLCGYRDKSEKEKSSFRTKENEYIQLYLGS